ncbi:hypothetical protein Y1Q_0019984 [Alligator mississippiensis]|uniref:Uncharacterized protein n=1 Tax=Alligator mississippiensis TaxID=8496 RepID=A0A151PDU1_ALLMI|nr:hypothetical protein Y1Q_0019984 [Alligator mississippiensis]
MAKLPMLKLTSDTPRNRDKAFQRIQGLNAIIFLYKLSLQSVWSECSLRFDSGDPGVSPNFLYSAERD